VFGLAGCFAGHQYFGWLCRLVSVLLFVLSGYAQAQEVKLNAKENRNRETITVKLYDNNEGRFLLELPLTFHITQNNILFMIVGDEKGVPGNQALWMFDKPVSLTDFLKWNKQVGASKTFKKQMNQLESFFSQSENVEKFTWFDNGFEQVQVSPKPVFFKVGDPTKPVVLKLKFYTSIEKPDRSQELTSEAGSVKVTIHL
jgi:hypothetical protein